MTRIVVNKEYFKNLNPGIHTLRANLKDGYAECQFNVVNAIKFTILGVECEASEGMTWEDWFISTGSVAGNAYAQRNHDTSDNRIYINWSYPDTRFNADGHGAFDSTEWLNNSAGWNQKFNDILINGESYGRHGDGFGNTGEGADEPV